MSLLGNLDLSVNAQVGGVPIAAPAEGEDVVRLDRGDDVIIILEPVIAGGMDPPNVVTTVGRATFVGDDPD